MIAPLLRHQSPAGGRGTVAMGRNPVNRKINHNFPEPVIRHYRNAGDAHAAGDEPSGESPKSVKSSPEFSQAGKCSDGEGTRRLLSQDKRRHTQWNLKC